MIDFTYRLCGTIAIAIAAASVQAHAATPQEDELFKAPMPHEAYGRQGAQVPVHRARLHGYFNGKEGNAAQLARLKENVQACVADHQRTGQPVNPPNAWPDYMVAHRDDYYLAAQRSIHYSSGVTYLVRIGDCSLLAKPVHTARLESSEGICQIDLVNKIAKGRCGPDGHVGARPMPARAGAGGGAEALQRMANDPARAAAAAQFRQLAAYASSKTAQRKEVKGVTCDVWSLPAVAGGGTACYATGGSFRPSVGAASRQFGGLLMNMDQPEAMKLDAIDAAMDTTVSAAVFTPYAGGGYTFTGGAGQ
jgi:hypothetical protein